MENKAAIEWVPMGTNPALGHLIVIESRRILERAISLGEACNLYPGQAILARLSKKVI